MQNTEKMMPEIIVDREFQCSITEGKTVEEACSVYDIQVISNQQSNPVERTEVTILFSWPILDICGIWYPNCQKERSLQADWCDLHKSMTCVSAPVISLYSEDGRNRLTFALAEAAKEIFMGAGVREEDGTLSCKIRIPLKQNELPFHTQLYMNWQDIDYAEALKKTAFWWEKDCGMIPMEVPKSARLPMYSAWYSFHQDFTAKALEEEAVLAKKAGFETLIVDDGWQTEDNNRGYAYCGDWMVACRKIPDMKAHVKKIHEIGMKYMLWFSVPFVGKESVAWKSFQEMLLWYDESRGAGVLDIRYPEVRKYILSFYERAIGEWDMDGLKLDFVDEFYIRPEHPVPFKEGMDFERVEDAVIFFLNQVRNTLEHIKADVMLEFRQWYVGPHMRTFGNIIRVTDCPASAMNNRIGSVDIRLLSGNTAVHSDMIMWHPLEAPENAARQIIHSLFANLQLSVKLEEQSQENQKMIVFWTKFLTEKEEILQEGNLYPMEPQNLYPVVTAARGNEAITAVYGAGRKVVLAKEYSRHTFVNGVKDKELLVEVEKAGQYHVLERDCMGEIRREEMLELSKGIHALSITPSGMLEINGE